MLRGRCACNAVAYEVADEFVAAFNCHCSNCRATTGSAFLPWGEIEREKLRVTKAAGSLMVIGDADADHAIRCGTCGSLPYWTVRNDAHVRVPYGSLVDEPALRPTAHMFVGSKASWHEIVDDLPQHDEYSTTNTPGADRPFPADDLLDDPARFGRPSQEGAQ